MPLFVYYSHRKVEFRFLGILDGLKALNASVFGNVSIAGRLNGVE